ncbi:hypothetical protein FQA39_LY18916 [Lamprigera yunnana]|nr:hypothetical protein FQA39_LY18916 [Lamprigera yunnana]
MIPLGPVVARSRVKAVRSATWSFLVDSDRRAEWWPDLQIEQRVGGSIVERWSEGSGEDAVSRDASGTVDVWVEGHAIGFTWREAGDDRERRVLLPCVRSRAARGSRLPRQGFEQHLPSPAERPRPSLEGWQVLLRDLTAAKPELGGRGGSDAEGAPEVEPAEGDPAVENASSLTGELEVVSPVVDGELEDIEGEVTEALEVDAEPELGEHLELNRAPGAEGQTAAQTEVADQSADRRSPAGRRIK